MKQEQETKTNPMKTKSAEAVLSDIPYVQESLIVTRKYYEDDVIKAMQIYAEQFKPKWVPVTERLPEVGIPVLVFQPNNESKHFEQFVCTYDGNVWRDYRDDSDEVKYEMLYWFDEITHWQPLPELPID